MHIDIKIFLLGIFIAIFLVPNSFAVEENTLSSWDQETEINVSIIGSSVINLDLNNRLIRAYVDVTNFDPNDGRYVMKIIQPITDKIISEKEIVIREKGNGKAGTDVGYMINEDEIIGNGTSVLGDYSIVVDTENGSAIGGTVFSIIHPSVSGITSISEASDLDEVTEDVDELIEPEKIVEPIEEESLIDNDKKIPDWVNNIFILYVNGSITENELIAALTFLIDQGIIVINQ